MNIAKMLIVGLFILTLFSPAKDIKADYIHLKNGSILSGVLVEGKARSLIYRVPYGEIFINRENVDKIVHESRDKPLVREAAKYLKDKKFKQAIRTCGEALEIRPDNVEALEFKQRAVDAWQRYEAKRQAKIQREKAERERRAKELKKMQTDVKNKLGIAIRKEGRNYIIGDVYNNCPLAKGKILPGDIITAIHNTRVAPLPIKKVYNFLLRSKKPKITVKRPVVLPREKILWRGTKKYVGLGISIEKIDKGIKITNVMPKGPATKAGVLKGDIIVSLKGQTISSSSMDEIIKMLKGHAGTKLKATILREVTLKQ